MMRTPINSESVALLQSDFLQDVAALLQAKIAPHACEIDADPVALKTALAQLAQQGWLALRVQHPAQDLQFQGQPLDRLTYLKFQECISRHSGALAFLQTQHQSAAALIASSANDSLKERYLPQLATGKTLMGVGFSQLRRPGPPLVTAIPVADGYRLQGKVPWITGWRFFDSFIVGAKTPNQQVLMALIPFQKAHSPQGGNLQLSAPLRLAAMASTLTVTATLEHWFIPQADVVQLYPADWLHRRDQANVLHHAFFALGCTQAALDVMALAPATDMSQAVQATFHPQLAQLQQQIYTAEETGCMTYRDRLALRARAILLAQQTALACVTLARGAALDTAHPAQRIYREALAYTVFGQTTDVMNATLAALMDHPSQSPP